MIFHWIINENFKGFGMHLWCCLKDLKEQDFMKFILKDLDVGGGKY
jgi:hypothetical protein